MYVDMDLSQECSESLKSMEEDSNIFDNSIEFDTIESSDISEGKPVGQGSFNSVRTILNELPTRKRTSAIDNGAFSNAKKSTSEKYALKRIRSDLSDSMLYTGVIDLAKEAIFLAALSHPNIVKLHSAANNPGHTDYFLVIEQIDATLSEKCAIWYRQNLALKNADMPKKQIALASQSRMDRRAAIMLDVASALRYLHGMNILYRDLKPDNIGMDKEGNIKIFDFGMATELKSCARFGPDEYNATAYTGTLRYISPENLFGKPYGLPSDIYSFALVLYEVVTLEKPFDNYPIHSFARKVHVWKRRPALRRNMNIPKVIKNLITCGWQHDPKARPTVTSIFRDLSEYLSDKEVFFV